MADSIEPNDEIISSASAIPDDQIESSLEKSTLKFEMDDQPSENEPSQDKQTDQQQGPVISEPPEPEKSLGESPEQLDEDNGSILKKTKLIMLVIGSVGLILGGLVSGWITYSWFDQNNTYRRDLEILRKNSDQTIKELQATVKQLERTIEDRELEFNNLSLGYAQVSKLLERSNSAPAKPRYKAINDGILIYWLDDVLWRRYFVYKAKGTRKKLKKQSRKPQKKNFLYIKKLPKGTWRYAITAVDREGKETGLSDTLTIKINR